MECCDNNFNKTFSLSYCRQTKGAQGVLYVGKTKKQSLIINENLNIKPLQ